LSKYCIGHGGLKFLLLPGAGRQLNRDNCQGSQNQKQQIFRLHGSPLPAVLITVPIRQVAGPACFAKKGIQMDPDSRPDVTMVDTIQESCLEASSDKRTAVLWQESEWKRIVE
jgi:hypothetical protein